MQVRSGKGDLLRSESELSEVCVSRRSVNKMREQQARLHFFLEAVNCSDKEMRKWRNQKTVQADLGFLPEENYCGKGGWRRVLITQDCGC